MIPVILVVVLCSTIQVKELGQNGIEFSLVIEDQDIEKLDFPGASWLAEEGEPDVPSILYKIGIPQGGNVDIQIIENDETIISNYTVEPVRYVGILEPGPIPLDPSIAKYKEDVFYPGELYEISKPAYFRDLYTIDLRINPVQYNPVSRQLKISRRLKIRLSHNGIPKIRPTYDQSFDAVYQGTVINFDQCKLWRRDPLPTILNNPFLTGAWFKIEIGAEGLYQIGHDELRAVNIDPAQFDPRTMKIYSAAFDLLPRDVTSIFPDSMIEIPIFVEGEGDGSFDRNDKLYFYGFPASHFTVETMIGWYENGYALNNVYWFTFGGSNGQRMESVNASYNGSSPGTIVRDIIHYEEDVGNPTRSGINWYWKDISPGDGDSGSCLINLQHPSAQGNATLGSVFFTLNADTWIYQMKIDDQTFYYDTIMLSSMDRLPGHLLTGTGVLNSDSSEFEFMIIRPAGTTTPLIAYFNALTLEYDRRADFDNPFHAIYHGPANYTLRCTNADNNAFILDITDSRQPKRFVNYTIEGNDLTLSSDVDSLQFLYFSRADQAQSAVLQAVYPGKLKQPDAGAEYLIITHENFANAIHPLVNYRRRDYSVKLVKIGDIYNDFSFGKYDPLAIKHFLYYTLNNWTTVPKYILLVGDATYDYKNNLQKENPPNYIPMYEWGTVLRGNPGIPPNGIYEGEYVNFGGGEAMIQGRITVRTKQEVRDFIDKLLAYETGPIDGLWNKRILAAADDEYSNSYKWEWYTAPHSYQCESVFEHVPDSLYDFAKVYMVSYPPFQYPASKPNAQQAFIKELNRGCYAGVYYGHGNTNQLADEGLFYDTNIPQVKNGRRFFFFYFGSCTVSRFDDSDYECIGEQLVRIREGAIGTMGETAGSSPSGNQWIGDTLFSMLTRTDLTMGECFNMARQGEYLLLGDPATKMRRISNYHVMSATPDSVRPLEKITVIDNSNLYYLRSMVRDTTHISWFDETTVDRISGHVYRMVQTGPGSYVPFDYLIEGKEFYKGWWDDTAIVIIPAIVTNNLPVVSLSSINVLDCSELDSIKVYGSALPTTDETGPEVELYSGASKLKDGDWVEANFVLTGKISDESGINLMHSVNDIRGFFLYINNEVSAKTDLRDYFIYDRNSFASGEFNIPLHLNEAENTIVINVVDNYYNQTTDTIQLNAEQFNRIRIENVLVYPNPLRNRGVIYFTFSLTNHGIINIKVFTIAGRLIKTIENIMGNAGYNQIAWDVLDEYYDEISNGVYLIKISAENEGSKDQITEKFIIAR
ncbi:hypothetical protein A2Y85_00270 [candidate division WOR-3 bacterium RBG_13_43_14]|uniref:Gingipain domain-containing protein n=1 Tax=candidate division WOR-3 bacterium RBG_13_43_14 TaxID=1802590 RepID=A0A1F4U2J5_UNCW3|nr:MAG: hypothetical protein A2Y85_00270 [candidate division WOR-3 bacterium RBG_13_43_14]